MTDDPDQTDIQNMISPFLCRATTNSALLLFLFIVAVQMIKSVCHYVFVLSWAEALDST
jgi:hypothetical protein